MHQVVVTFIGPAISPPFRARLFSSLSTTVEVEKRWTLGRIINIAAKNCQISLMPDAVQIYGSSPSFADNLGGIQLTNSVTPGMRAEFDVFDRSGFLRWGVPFVDVEFRQLLESTKRGITPGNPARWQILVGYPGSGFDPNDLLTTIKDLEAIYVAFAGLKNGLEVAQFYSERLQAGLAVLKRHSKQLQGRGATLERLDNAAAALNRLDSLAKALGISPSEAADLVALWGYEPNGSCWHFTGSEAETMRMLTYLSRSLPYEVLQRDGSSDTSPTDWARAVDEILTRK